MTFINKLDIYFSLYTHPYNKEVDNFINKLINEGVIIKNAYKDLIIECKNINYGLWNHNLYYGFLSSCWISNSIFNTVYNNLRPSRKTIIRFVEWLESNDTLNYSKNENDIILNLP